MLQALVISNAIHGIERMFVSNLDVYYDFAGVTRDFKPTLANYDVLIVPNGSDHIAMLRLKDDVQAFLDAGKTLMCFDGWFTGWIPRNQWVMDNSKKTIDVRYRVKTDRHGLFDGLDVNQFIFSHGMSGWWACGYIEAAPDADVLLEDTWERPIIVIDEVSTQGLMLLTASGPMADMEYDGANTSDIIKLYQRFLRLAASRNQSQPEPQATTNHSSRKETAYETAA
jgi:hypothetical protein